MIQPIRDATTVAAGGRNPILEDVEEQTAEMTTRFPSAYMAADALPVKKRCFAPFGRPRV
jgi:hypothetical protein